MFGWKVKYVSAVLFGGTLAALASAVGGPAAAFSVFVIVAFLLTRWAENEGRKSEASLLTGAREDLIAAEAAGQTLGQALAEVTDGVVLVRPDSTVAFMNAAARHLLPSPTIAEGRRIAWPELEELVESVTTTESPAAKSLRIRIPEERRLFVKAVSLLGGGCVMIVVDQTESDHLDRIRKDFVTNVSHELKTPVAAIQSLAEVLRTAFHDSDYPASSRFISRLEIESTRLSSLVTDLLDLSRVESLATLRPESINLQNILRTAADSVVQLAAQRNVDVTVQASEEVFVIADPRQLEMAVSNLIRNAVQYSDGGRATLSARSEGQSVVIEVSDEGIGIPSDELGRIFERFYRVDRARTRDTGGTGLGLAIVRHVVTNHGGTVEVASELGRGTKFRLTLPATESQRITY